jgi:hypothetical protein
MCVLIFSAFLSEAFLILKRFQRGVIVNVQISLCEGRFNSCHISVKLEFSRQIFEKYSNVEFHENLSSGSRVVPCGQTDMTKLIVAFCDFAKRSPKIPLSAHRAFVFLWTSEQTAIISLNNIDWLVYITETESVYCAVRAWSFQQITVIIFKVLIQSTYFSHVSLRFVCWHFRKIIA